MYIVRISIKAIYEGNGRVSCPDGIEVLYLSVLDSEYITLKTIKFCIGLYEFIYIFKFCNGLISVITEFMLTRPYHSRCTGKNYLEPIVNYWYSLS